MSNNRIVEDNKICFLRLEGNKLFKSYGNDLEADYFVCQTNGIISDSIVQNWTPQAYDCYKINSNCAICPITKAKYSFKCQMKHIVDILLETQGLPDENIINNDIVA